MKTLKELITEAKHFTNEYKEWGFVSVGGILFDGGKERYKQTSHGELLKFIIDNELDTLTKKEKEYFMNLDDFRTEKKSIPPEKAMKIGWFHWFIDKKNDFDIAMDFSLKTRPAKQLQALLQYVEENKEKIDSYTVNTSSDKESLDRATYQEFIELFPEKIFKN